MEFSLQEKMTVKIPDFIRYTEILEINSKGTKEIKYKIKLSDISKKQFKVLQKKDIMDIWEGLIN